MVPNPPQLIPKDQQLDKKSKTIAKWREALEVEGLEDRYLPASKTKLVRWAGEKKACLIDVEINEVRASTFTTLAAPGCMLEHDSNKKALPVMAYYEVTILEYGEDAVLQAGWATLAMERSDDNDDEGVGNSLGSWSVDGIHQVREAA